MKVSEHTLHTVVTLEVDGYTTLSSKRMPNFSYSAVDKNLSQPSIPLVGRDLRVALGSFQIKMDTVSLFHPAIQTWMPTVPGRSIQTWIPTVAGRSPITWK